MKLTSNATSFLATCLSAALLSGTLPAQAETVRVLSYNVQDCFNLGRKDQNVERTAEVIRKLAPDVAGIQELDRNTKRSKGHDIAGELAEKTGMELSYGKTIDFQGGAYGIGILSKKKPIRAYTVPLPGKEEKRALQIAEFETYVFFCTHLSLTKNSKIESVPLINAEAAKFSKPIILVGDFNAYPDSEPIQELRKTWKQVSVNGFTFPANAPTVQIDYIFLHTDKPYRAEHAAIIEEPSVSDHRPITVELTWEP
ncbi:MAG: endonuclease/exonuclease/phosphatase family protein [Kiritimatiellae bacterium]|nr:endonuclease/exonuclease/phosphatase family protein [Kiritimatiellia bacterium]